jgi:thymidylate synthase
MILAHRDFTDLYVDVLRCLLHESTPHAKPRGMGTYEQLGCRLELLKSDCNLLVAPRRKLQYPFAIAEFSWIMMGSNDLALIQPYNTKLEQFSDDGMHLAGAYGPRIVDQLPYVIQKLKQDPWSRQAVIEIWRERPMESKDTPCTLSLQFFIRPGKDEGLYMDLITTMRSNDAWLGLPYDVFVFTMIQKYLAGIFQVSPGRYIHNVGSLHLYEKDREAALELIEESKSVTWRPRTSEVPIMPADYKALYTGLTLMSRHAETNDEMINWVTMANHMPEPWNTFLRVLAYRFHKNISHVPNPWHELIAGRKE